MYLENGISKINTCKESVLWYSADVPYWILYELSYLDEIMRK